MRHTYKLYYLMKTSEFVQKIENREAKILTLEAARSLKGKHIFWMYLGYEGNENAVQEMTVGDIVTEYDYYKSQPLEGYSSRAAYWESYMNAEQLQDTKDKLILLDEEGNDSSHIYAYTNRYNFYDVPTFTCSDADREVYYIVDEYTVLKEIYTDEERIFIVRNEDIVRNGYLHDTYDQYGQELDEESAGDYSLKNWYSSAISDMRLELEKMFNEDESNEKERYMFEDLEINISDLTVEDYEGLDIPMSEEDLNNWIKEWEKKNANYTTVDYITWWNGHNFQTHIIDAEEYGATLKRIDDKLAEEILSAYSEADDWEDYGTGCKCRVGEHLFKTTRFPHFYEAEVIIGEEEDEY